MKRYTALILVFSAILSVTVVAFAVSSETGFSDVAADAWYAEAVDYVQDNGLMSGTSATTFSPNGAMTRAMVATTLFGEAGSPAVTGTDTFSDTQDGAWYSDAVLWASQKGIVTGYGNGLFGTNDPVNREQIATILWRYAGSPTTEAGEDFADEASISPYASTAVDWARNNGIINGMDGNRFAPQMNVTRAQVATILRNYRMKENSEAQDGPVEERRVLVAYFSRVGNTNFDSGVDAVTSASINLRNGNFVGNNQLVAEAIHEQMGGDLVEITVREPYPSDYEETVEQNRMEQQSKVLPELSMQVDMADYDTIFIGYPIWAMTVPMPVQSFLREYDFAGKTVIPFCTHAGYGAGQSEALIRELCPDSEVLPVFAVDDDDLDRTDTLVGAWLDTLDLNNSLAVSQEITLEIGGQIITAELNDTPAAQEFARSLPITVSMTRMGEHEYYGALEAPLSEQGNTLQTGYTVGDLAFWTPGDLFAFYFDEPETPPEGLMILGHITSDLAVFSDLGGRESVRISLAD